MEIVIYYFSGTGNSLFAAKKIKEKLPNAELQPLVPLLREKRVTTDAGVVGFVFPVHALTLPLAVSRFLKKYQPQKDTYHFALATRGGTFFRGFEKADRLLGAKGAQLHGATIVDMGGNDPRGEDFVPPTPELVESLKLGVMEKIDRLIGAVQKREIWRPADTEWTIGLPFGRIGNKLIEGMILGGMKLANLIGGVQYFYHDQSCNGCRICEKVCLSGKIAIKEGKPIWKPSTLCYMCYACINFCPKHSVQVKSIPGVVSHTPRNGRYFHPYASVKNMVQQKRGN